MRDLFVLATAACLLQAPAARAQMSTYEAALRFADVVALVESKFAAGAPADTSHLWHLCLSHGRLKNYAKLFDCVPRLEASIAKGDIRAKGDYFIPFSVDARPMPGMLMAEAYAELGDYENALAAGTKAHEIVKDGSNDSSTWPPIRYKMAILPTLAIAATLGGNRPRALEFAKELEDVSVPFMGGSMHRNNKKIALARTYMALGDYEKAIDNLSGPSAFDRLALGLADVTNPFASRGDSLATATELPRMLMLGKALAETGKPQEAADILDKVIASPRLKDAGDLHWLALAERGRVAERLGKPEEAAEFYRKAIEVIERQRSTLNTEASKIGFIGDKQAVYGRLVAVLVAQQKAAEAFDFVERSKSRALVDMLASKKDFAVQAPDPAKVKLILAQLESAELAARIQSPEETTGGVRNLQVVRETIRGAAPELSSLLSVTSVPFDDLRTLIAEDETLVEYYYFGEDLVAFVADRRALHAVKLDAKAVVDEIRALRTALDRPTGDEWRAPASALHRRLWQPLEGLVKTRKAIVVPHGAMHYLPFAALLSANGALLADSMTLRFLPAASVLRYLRPAFGNKAAPMLAFGNPDLGNPSMDLQFAGTEAVAVAKLFPDSRVLTRKDASETNFKKAGGLFSRLHFATHGKFVAEDPLNSGLHLAGDGENDGVLTVGELYTMSLDADLVTLSACETGLGKIANGDDVVGLTRGFLYAGSRSIIASLWSVDDKATAELMGAFYENLRTMPKDEALRQAQVTTRRNFAHPFFWAAFQLTGRTD